MSRHLSGFAIASVFALTATVAAQNPTPQYPPQNPPPTKPTTRAPASQDTARMVTVEGCLMREADVPGRKPNVAERAGIAEDYILSSAKMIKGSAPPPRAASTKPGEAATGTSGTRGALAMYEVEGIDEAELKKHVGRRVQIEGTFENIDRAQAAPEGKTPADDLVQLRGTVIRQVASECPAGK
jgi:hypothetical protein